MLSEYFEGGEIESCAEALEERGGGRKKHTFQDIIDSQKVEMKGSTLEPIRPPPPHLDRRRDRKISSSEIIEYKDFAQPAKTEVKP